MADKLRIGFIWDWPNDEVQLMTWEDGLYAALQELKKRGHEVEVYTICEALGGSITRDGLVIRTFSRPDQLEALIEAYKPSVLLHWGDCTRPNAGVGRKLGIKQAICFAGGQPFGPTWNNFDLFFVESDEYKLKFQAANVDVMTAFGTNTKLYDPKDERLVGQAKLFDVCFPATYAAWKRHKLFSEATQGLRTVCAGYMYDDHETECWKEPQRGGSFVLPHVPASGLRHLLAASRVCLITSETTGGSQRTVLEAMAMDVPVIVMDDSPKTSEYVLDAISKGYKVGAVVPPDPLGIKRAIYEWEDEKANGRQYILDTWSEKNYAEQINLGLNKLVGTR